MEEVPSPLRVGTPASGRKPSVDNVPEALRVGSPVVDRGAAGSPFSQRPPLRRYGSSAGSGGSNRLTQLLSQSESPVITPPSETPSVSSSRRNSSFPSPLLPAAKPAYKKPEAPSTPSFADEDTSYNSTRDQFAQAAHARPTNVNTTGTRRLLERLTSLKRARSGAHGKYGILEDLESGSSHRLGHVDEEDESIGVDLGGYEGTPLKNMKTGKSKKMASAADEIQAERDLNEAGYAAEYERLEAQLGSGMSSIMEMPFLNHNDEEQLESQPKRGHRRGLSTVDVPARNVEAQAEAEKIGEILAVSEVTDISNIAGADFDTRSILTTDYADNGESKTSYYFPEDPDMPSWRPFSMTWPYISMLIALALLMAGLQEFLCQLSIRRAKNNDGLLRFKRPNDLSILEYFTWKYAPVMVFVIYGILWQISDFEVKRLEPFYQLSKKSGATAGESLNMDYLTFLSWLVPLRALRHKQYAVIYSSLATLVASSLVPVLQSASVIMYPPKKEREVDKPKYVRIDPRWSRAVSASLVFSAICGCVLLYQLRRKSGLLSDPKGIAGIAAMATRSHILTDFKGLDTAPLDKIHKQLRHRRYILHKSSLWQGEFIRNSTERVREHGTDPRPLMLRLRAGVPYISFMILFAISIPIFMFNDGANVVTEKIPFFLTAIATIIKLIWGTMNNDIRMLEPFYLLSLHKAPPRTLTLDYTGTNPIFLPFKAALNKQYLVAIVGLGSILTEVLTVCVSSFSVDGKKFIPGQGHPDNGMDDVDDRYNTEETFRSFWVSFALVIAILFILVSIACTVYLRRSHKFMPRQIGTMASVLAFIHQSKMLVTFVDTEKFDSSQMTRHLERVGKTYGLGWFSGRDGEDHLGIDEEPMLAEYKYGVDWTKGRVLPSHIGTWEHY